MSTQHNGGSAFPQIQTDTFGERGDYRQETYSAGGMTLRDYFAAKAMQAYASDEAWRLDMDAAQTAKAAYNMADAMLKARDA